MHCIHKLGFNASCVAANAEFLKKYLKCLAKIIFSRKFFLLCYVILLVSQIPKILKNFSFAYVAAALIVQAGASVFQLIVFVVFVLFYGSYIYDRDLVMKSEITMNFNEDDFEEIPPYSSYKFKYEDNFRILFLKSLLVIYVGPARMFIISRRKEYEQLFQDTCVFLQQRYKVEDNRK